MSMLKILLLGGSGKLGSCLRDSLTKQKEVELYAPSHAECDITDYSNVLDAVNAFKPDILINSAAMVGNKECEDNKEKCWAINVEGAVNIARVCSEQDIRLIHVSTSSIFDGQKGNYSESDVPTPAFYYAVCKAAAEQAVKVVPDYAIVRLDFFPLDKLKYYDVFSDHYTSKIRVDDAAERIIKILRSSFVGIINIGCERESLFSILQKEYPTIRPIKIEESSLPHFPRDLSLDVSLWKKLFSEPEVVSG